MPSPEPLYDKPEVILNGPIKKTCTLESNLISPEVPSLSLKKPVTSKPNISDIKPTTKVNEQGKTLSGSSVKRFKCPDCNQLFKRTEHLLRHSLTHSGEKPFKCNICSRTFARADAHNRHLKIHTDDPFITDAHKAKHSTVVYTAAAKKALESQRISQTKKKSSTDADSFTKSLIDEKVESKNTKSKSLKTKLKIENDPMQDTKPKQCLKDSEYNIDYAERKTNISVTLSVRSSKSVSDGIGDRTTKELEAAAALLTSARGSKVETNELLNHINSSISSNDEEEIHSSGQECGMDKPKNIPLERIKQGRDNYEDIKEFTDDNRSTKTMPALSLYKHQDDDNDEISPQKGDHDRNVLCPKHISELLFSHVSIISEYEVFSFKCPLGDCEKKLVSAHLTIHCGKNASYDRGRQGMTHTKECKSATMADFKNFVNHLSENHLAMHNCAYCLKRHKKDDFSILDRKAINFIVDYFGLDNPSQGGLLDVARRSGLGPRLYISREPYSTDHKELRSASKPSEPQFLPGFHSGNSKNDVDFRTSTIPHHFLSSVLDASASLCKCMDGDYDFHSGRFHNSQHYVSEHKGYEGDRIYANDFPRYHIPFYNNGSERSFDSHNSYNADNHAKTRHVEHYYFSYKGAGRQSCDINDDNCDVKCSAEELPPYDERGRQVPEYAIGSKRLVYMNDIEAEVDERGVAPVEKRRQVSPYIDDATILSGRSSRRGSTGSRKHSFSNVNFDDDVFRKKQSNTKTLPLNSPSVLAYATTPSSHYLRQYPGRGSYHSVTSSVSSHHTDYNDEMYPYHNIAQSEYSPYEYMAFSALEEREGVRRISGPRLSANIESYGSDPIYSVTRSLNESTGSSVTSVYWPPVVYDDNQHFKSYYRYPNGYSRASYGEPYIKGKHFPPVYSYNKLDYDSRKPSILTSAKSESGADLPYTQPIDHFNGSHQINIDSRYKYRDPSLDYPTQTNNSYAHNLNRHSLGSTLDEQFKVLTVNCPSKDNEISKTTSIDASPNLKRV